jgi:hypothetical protein
MRRLLAIPLVLIASLAFTTAVLAGGWAQVTMTDPPIDPAAGGGTTIGFQVLQHGQTAVSWPRITVVATNTTTGAAVTAAARAEGPTGHYVATLVFPSEGSWTLTYLSQDLQMEGSSSLAVAPAAPVAAAPGTAVDPLPIGLAGLVLLVLLIGGAFVIRGRRGARGDRHVTVSG